MSFRKTNSRYPAIEFICRKKGFAFTDHIVEILIVMVILVIVILITSGLFNQSLIVEKMRGLFGFG